MAESPVFEQTCDLLEQHTNLDRLEARGTVRIALKTAGLDAKGVDSDQMGVVLRRVLPAELSTRGIADPQAFCSRIADELAGMTFAPVADRAGAVGSAVSRFGS